MTEFEKTFFGLLDTKNYLNIDMEHLFPCPKLPNLAYYHVNLSNEEISLRFLKAYTRRRYFRCLHESDCQKNKFESKIVFPCS